MSTALSCQANRPFKLDKRRQLFIRTHYETLSVDAMSMKTKRARFQSAASSWCYGNGGTKFSKKRTSLRRGHTNPALK